MLNFNIHLRIYIYLAVLAMEPRALHLLGKCSISLLIPVLTRTISTHLKGHR